MTSISYETNTQKVPPKPIECRGFLNVSSFPSASGDLLVSSQITAMKLIPTFIG